MASLMEGINGLNISWLNNFNIWHLATTISLIFAFGVLGVVVWFWYDHKNSIRANISLIDDRNGTRKMKSEKIVEKRYPSGNKYLMTYPSRIPIKPFKREYVFTTGGKLDRWIGYLDSNGFVHPVGFSHKNTYFKSNGDGSVIVKEEPLFQTIPEDLANFYLKTTEERVEKNKVLSFFEKMQPAMIMGACVMGSIIIIVVLALGK